MHPSNDRTRDSRFLRHRLFTGEDEFYGMYSRNIRAEGDGLAYNELNILRAAVLEPILYVVMGSNLLLAYTSTPESADRYAYVLAHSLGAVCNVFRVAIGIVVLGIEAMAWPLRVAIGSFLWPLGWLISAGHIYALPASIVYAMDGAGADVVRRVKIKSGIPCKAQVLNAGILGQVLWYETNTFTEASYIGCTFKLQQRCGIGPECIWVRGRNVFISYWSPISIKALLSTRETIWWKVLDLTSYEWRATFFEFEKGNLLQRRPRIQRAHRHEESDAGMATSSEVGSWAHIKSDVRIGEVSCLADLEELYNSPLGWNKYHLMRAEGDRVRIVRHDRRILSHFVAAVSSLLFYLQFRDASQGRLGVSVELYGLILAQYTLVTAYAAEIVIGKVSDVVDAKSDRYGVIVTRAIDRGYVRGFHVPNGDWLRYGNGDIDLPNHEVKGTEVSLTCSSYVYPTESGKKIMVLPYNTDTGDERPWHGID